MSLIDKKRDEITAQYNADLEALRHSAKIIADHEEIAKQTGLIAVVSIYFANASVWLTSLSGEADSFIETFHGDPAGWFVGKRVVFKCNIDGKEVFILGD